MKLALYKHKRRWLGDIGPALIRWWTKSPYSHCELVIDGLAYSSSVMDGGVRSKRIEFDPDHWDFVDLPWAEKTRALRHFHTTVGEPYGWLDLLWRQVFNHPGDAVGAFCSEWCAAALGLSHPQQYSPGKLGEYCKLRIA
ncbi:MAG: hypothetical protein RBT67_02760 [Thauera sp.]|nr:hypothetical protein [Thauera sp.]